MSTIVDNQSEKIDNELIAEFMDVQKIDANDGIMWDYFKTRKQIYCLRSNNLHYDTSWDWLMPVVEKISRIPTDDDDSYYPRTFGMRDADGNQMFRFNRHPLYTAKTLIEATHAAVVEFIKFYNSQKYSN